MKLRIEELDHDNPLCESCLDSTSTHFLTDELADCSLWLCEACFYAVRNVEVPTPPSEFDPVGGTPEYTKYPSLNQFIDTSEEVCEIGDVLSESYNRVIGNPDTQDLWKLLEKVYEMGASHATAAMATK